MTSEIDDIDQSLEDEEELLVDEPLEALEPTPEDLAETTAVPPEQGIGEVESIQDLLAKQETASEQAEAETEEEEETSAALKSDERLEPLETRVVPMQSSEFMCKRCFLVKHRSQLADKKKMLCRDCA